MAERTAWTPGPWERSGDLIGRYIEGRREWACVACMETIRGDFPGEEEANSHLIAAAPDLYEAADTAKRALKLAMRTLVAADLSDAQTAYASLEKALAKARGEHP